MKENNFKDPLLPLITNPVGVDRPIQDMQLVFAELSWIEKAFGRSFLAIKPGRGVIGVKEKAYPHVWQGFDDDGKPRDMLEVMPNDNIKSQVFFKVDEPIQVTEFLTTGDNSYLANVSAIFWFDYQRIDPTINFPFIELLKGQVLRALSDMVFSDQYSNINVTRIYETPSQVFAGYAIEPTRLQELIYPKGGFRIDMEVRYRDDCPASHYQIPIPTVTLGTFNPALMDDVPSAGGTYTFVFTGGPGQSYTLDEDSLPAGFHIITGTNISDGDTVILVIDPNPTPSPFIIEIIYTLDDSTEQVTLPVTQLAQAHPGLAAGCAAFFPLGDTIGPVLLNTVNPGANGSIDGPDVVLGLAGLLGNAVEFGGQPANKLLLGNIPVTDTISVSMWVKPLGTALDRVLLQTNDATVGSLAAYIDDTNKFWMAVTGQGIINLGLITVPPGVWSHLVFGYNTITGQFFTAINGAMVGISVNLVPNAQLGLFSFGLGIFGGAPYAGRVEHIGIWDRLITPTEVAQVYNAGLPLAFPF